MKSTRITIRALRRRTWKLLSFDSSIAIDSPSQMILSPIDVSSYVGINPISRCSEIPQHDSKRRVCSFLGKKLRSVCLNSYFAYVYWLSGENLRKVAMRRFSLVNATRLWMMNSGSIQWCRLFLRSLHRTSLRSQSSSENARDATIRIPHPRGSSSDAITMRVDRIPLSLTLSVILIFYPRLVLDTGYRRRARAFRLRR